MGLFGNKTPKLPSYVGVPLAGLLQDPQWSYPIAQSGINPRACELVLHLASPTVGVGGSTRNASPAVLFGQGSVLALAFPTEREVTVVKRDKARANLQTQRSGWFQILFGAAGNLDGFMFWDPQDNLRLGTPEGETFGKFMLAFLAGDLSPQQVVGTPQSMASSGFAPTPPPPPVGTFDDPQDALRWDMLNALNTSLVALMDLYQQCFEKTDMVQRAYAIANAEYVDGIRQHEISRENFRKRGVQLEGELTDLLMQLRAQTVAAQTQWRDLIFLLPPAENDGMAIMNWSMAHGIDASIYASVIANSIIVPTDFGLTADSFAAENNRLTDLMNRAGQ